MWKGCSEAEIRQRALGGHLPQPPADAPPALVKICRRALSLAPTDRHATAMELADELEAALSELGPPISRRQIGALVAKLFERERAATMGLLEQESQRNPVVGDPSPVRDLSAPEQASAPRWRGRRISRRGMLWAMTGTAFVALGLTYVIVRRHGAAPGPVQAPAVSSSKPQAPPVGTLPASPSPEEPVPPTAAAPAVPDDGPRRAPPRGSARGSSKRSQPSTTPGEPADPNLAGSPAKDDCKHPFFFDAKGIKKFRPECM
jgi:serine/threonine-protein kinase